MRKRIFTSILFSLTLVLTLPTLALANEYDAPEEKATIEQRNDDLEKPQENQLLDPSSNSVEKPQEDSPTSESDSTEKNEADNVNEAPDNKPEQEINPDNSNSRPSTDDPCVSGSNPESFDNNAENIEEPRVDFSENDIAESKPSPNQTIKDDIYIIETGVSDHQVLDVQGASLNNGANVQTYTYNGTNAQRWNVTFDTDTDSYIIANIASGKPLDLSLGTVRDGNNIWQYENNNTAAQRWLFIQNVDGSFTIVSALDHRYALDVSSAHVGDGTNIQLWMRNGTIAQSFWLLSKKPLLPVIAVEIEEGCYSITSALNENAVIDIATASSANGANVQIYSSNSTGAQKFYFSRQDDGTYSIYNIASGKVLDVANGSPLSSANVWQYTYNGTDAQKWIPIYNQTLGAYSFVSKLSGMYLDISGASTANSTNVQVFRGNGTPAQLFMLNPVSFLKDGIYAISTAENGQLVVDVVSAGTTADSPIQIYASNGTLAQRFELVTTAHNTYTLRSACSGLLLGLNENGSVVLSSDTSSKETQWTVFWCNGGLALAHATNNQVVHLENGKVAQGSLLLAGLSSSALPQRFFFTIAPLISNGYYVIQSAIGELVVDVAAGDRRNQANVQLYAGNGTNAQKFYIELVNNDVYRILNAATNRAIDVAGGSIAQGANVQMFRNNGTDAQLWKIALGKNGYLTFSNFKSGMVLDVAGAGNYSGVNIQVYTSNGTRAQQFRLAETTYIPDTYVVLNVPTYNQYAAGLPTGCESCALTNALRYYGLNLGNTEIADVYMPWSNWDFVYAFWGNPHTTYGNSTMAPCISNTANRCLTDYGIDLRAHNVTGSDFYSLFSHIERGNPVVIWSTIGTSNPSGAYGWQDGYTIYANSHTIVLSGYNKANNTVYVSDSISGTYWCNAGDLAWLYNQMGRQAVTFI